MTLITILAGLKKYAPVIAAVATGIAAIATQNYSVGVSQILQGLSLLFGGTAVAAIHHEISKASSAASTIAKGGLDATSPALFSGRPPESTP